MKWYYYQRHIDEKPIVHNFIDKMIAVYGVTKNFSVYEKITGRELLIYLQTDDTEISRRFIDYFMEGIPRFDTPINIDSLTLIYSNI